MTAAAAEPRPAEPFALQPGDVVELNSGAPEMTVARVYEAGVSCVWPAQTLHRSTFPSDDPKVLERLDFVRLNSGGPEMLIVAEYDCLVHVLCVWAGENGELACDIFVRGTLARAPRASLADWRPHARDRAR